MRTLTCLAKALTGRATAGARSITSRSFSSNTTGPKTPLSASSVPPSESLAQRSLFINVRPPPATLSERRSVLGVLERYGKVEMFKKLADNSSFVCIASSANMATALVQRSPLQYELLAENLQAVQPWGQPRVANVVQSVLRKEGEHHTSSASSSSSKSSLSHRSFVVSVFPSPDYHHRTMIRNSPLHGPWPRDESRPSGLPGSPSVMTAVATNADGYRETFVYNALKAVVPESASSEALCDWRPRTEWNTGTAGKSASGSPPERYPAQSRIQERLARRAHINKSILSSLVGRSGNGKLDE
ncbi:hypothetical protein SEPCBS57363_001527 [Sporothrix epigloea]|uniref:Pal1-like protein n=1 Tax=Sporothrix epigloea TaxID=1892477 RepID=A0ABP0DCG1_9PEZI